MKPSIAAVKSRTAPAFECNQARALLDRSHPPSRHILRGCERGTGERSRCEDAEHPVRRAHDGSTNPGPQLDRIDAAKGRLRKASAPGCAGKDERPPPEGVPAARRRTCEPQLEPGTREPAHRD